MDPHLYSIIYRNLSQRHSTVITLLHSYSLFYIQVYSLIKSNRKLEIKNKMLTCIARSKQPNDDPLDHPNKFSQNIPSNNKQPIKSLSSQIKDMALKASGAYKQCNPCTSQPLSQNPTTVDSDSAASTAASEKFRWTYKRSGSFNSASAGRKELEARLKGISSGEATPLTLSASASGRRVDQIVFVEENEPKEWVAQVEPGVLITFLSLPRGGNDLKRIRFNRDMYNKFQAQRWWAENYERVMELYNVQRLNRQAFPLPTTARSEDESSKRGSVQNSPVTPPLTKERLPRALTRPVAYSSSDSLDHQSVASSRFNNTNCDSSSSILGASTPKISSLSGTAKTITTEASSLDADTSMDTGSSREYADRSGELSISNASDLETEWVEQDEPGVYITIRALPDGRRELRRVRFSREMFGEVHARVWWEENRSRIHKQYL
ncbi:hypothetical protein Leryth_002642 [Lithospermum erythrorhizon]|nr:hypothetical protein Leryth_002642 [Lithospermum erythrorhizon]